jgi:SAM-dependent MidA family methyltransferase
LYGEGGFYVAPGAPGRNFRTSAHASPQWAAAIHVLAAQVDAALGTPDRFTVVDVGAGGGELLTGLADLAPPQWSLVGVDLAPRPPDLPDRVAWRHEPPKPVCGLLVANELLDVVPVDVVELDPAGPRLIEVARDGTEHLGGAPAPEDAAWLERWWPLATPGDRAEIGHSRDQCWRELTRCLESGVAVAIDYAAVPERDVAGTLAGYRDGRQVQPIPDGSCDITAHVLFESLLSDGDVLLSQREALRDLGIDAGRPSYDGDPLTYLSALSATGEAAELIDPGGLGGFTWLVHQVGVAVVPARS